MRRYRRVLLAEKPMPRLATLAVVTTVFLSTSVERVVLETIDPNVTCRRAWGATPEGGRGFFLTIWILVRARVW